jgi:4-cresol dehydrogenase (hydroxylating)
MSFLTTELERAISEWRALLGEKRVLAPQEAQNIYSPNTEGVSRQIAGALYPENVDEIISIVNIANRYKTPLYPISHGNNWGYGSALPPVDGCVIVDLSRMKRILDFNNELGYVTIEPGVTQAQLYDFLVRKKARYIMPVTDAGPDSTLVGCALERGLSITNASFLFDWVTSLQAVLPTGRLYRSALTEMGCEKADKVFKWGVGPYLDGIFTQSNYGIVTQMTFSLPLKPEAVEPFYFQIKEGQLEEIIELLREIFWTLKGNTNYFSLVDARYALAMTAPYPFQEVGKGKILPQNVLDKLCKKHNIAPWMGGGALYGPQKFVEALQNYIRKTLRGKVKGLTFFTPKLFQEMKKILPPKRIKSFRETIEHLQGKSTEIPLKLAYWKSRQGWKAEKNHPARDGSGIIWYSPVVPLKGMVVRTYVEMVRKICAEYGIEPLFTLVIADTHLFGIVPILFDAKDPEEVKRAHACYEALFKAGEKKDFIPYRVPAPFMHLVVDPAHPFWNLVSSFKNVLDPNHILSPGRYCPL